MEIETFLRGVSSIGPFLQSYPFWFKTAVMLVFIGFFFVPRVSDPPSSENVVNSSIEGILSDGSGKAIKVMRERHGVRPLTDLEDDLTIARLPENVYGFLSPRFLSLEKGTVSREKIGAPFELHKLKGGKAVILAFVSQENALRIEELDRISLTFFPKPWEEARLLVGIPREFIISTSVRRFREQSAVEVTLDKIRLQQSNE